MCGQTNCSVAVASCVAFARGDADALALFKKPPQCSGSVMQLAETTPALKSQLLSVPERAQLGRKGDGQHLDVIMLALRGRKVNVDKVIKMACMVELLQTEQHVDIDKKEYCKKQFRNADAR